jgi:hypothetical protein
MKKVSVWIFDDQDVDMDRAREATQIVAERMPCALEVRAFTKLAWPDLVPPSNPLPDILILDLVEQEKLRGNAIYETLRAQERLKKRPPAFVAIWSGRWDNLEAVAFVDQLKGRDPFMRDLEVKNRYELADVIEGFVRRIQEERVV